MNVFSLIKNYRDPWTDRQKTYFAIVHTPRSGSNYLAELLDSAEAITCHSEIFSPKSTYLSRQTQAPYIDKETRDQNPWRFLQRLVAHAAGSSAFGFKIGLYDRRTMLLYVLTSRRVKKLVIRRRNVLAAFVSSKKASQSGRWIQWSDHANGAGVVAKLDLSLPEFCLYALRRAAFYAAVRSIEVLTAQTFFWLDYEDVVRKRDWDDVIDFLDLGEVGRLSPRTTKQNAALLREQIGNLGRVEGFLRRACADWMLNE